MKLSKQKIDYATCEQNPLELFADMPRLFGTLQRLKLALARTVVCGINAHNYKRAGVILHWSHKLNLATNQAMQEYIGVIAKTIDMHVAWEEWEQEDGMSEEEYKKVGIVTHFFEQQEQFLQHLENIIYWEDKLINEDMVIRLLHDKDMSHLQKMELIDWLLGYIKTGMQYNEQFIWPAEQSAQQYNSSVLRAFDQGAIDSDMVEELVDSVGLKQSLAEVEDDNLAFLHFLLQQKRMLEAQGEWGDELSPC